MQPLTLKEADRSGRAVYDWICGLSLAGIADSSPTGDMDVFLLCGVVSVMGRFLLQSSLTNCGV